MNLIRSIIFNFIIYLIIIISCILALPLLFFPRKNFISKLSSVLGRLFIFFTNVILNTKVTLIYRASKTISPYTSSEDWIKIKVSDQQWWIKNYDDLSKIGFFPAG